MERTGEGPGADAFARARLDYETTRRPVASIAEQLGFKRHELMALVKREGWKLRTRRTPGRVETAKQTIARLKGLLQSRVASLESRIGELGADAEDATTEREIRATNMLVRTLEKVLDLERKDSSERNRARKQRRVVDDARREELARKLEALHGGRHHS
ncbi:MAG: hypothetical protein ACKVP5_11995 [Aestuariivirga sp.]